MRLLSLCKDLLIKLLESLRRFPLALLMAAAAVVIWIVLIHWEIGRDDQEPLSRLAMIFALGIPLFLSLQVLIERLPGLGKIARYLLYLAALGGLAAYYFFLLPDLKMVSGLRYTTLSFVFYLTFIFIPYFFRKPDFELYGIRLFTRFFTTYLYSIVLYMGLSAILFAIDKLLGVEISWKIYMDTWLVVAGIFAPAYFLAEIPQRDEQLEPESYPRVLRVLFLYIVMPLLAVYTVILYLYFAKVLFTWGWPKGIITHLVLWYGVISALVLFFIRPLCDGNRWAQVFTKIFPLIILLPLAMMFAAIYIRVSEYGITENRYFVLITGLWVAACMIYLGLAPRARHIILPVSAALVLFLSVCGPLSAFSISKYSQNLRFEALVQKYNMIFKGKVVATKQEIPITDLKQISEVLKYFNTSHRLSDIRCLPSGATLETMDELLGFPVDLVPYSYRESINISYNLADNSFSASIQDYDYFFSLQRSYNDPNWTNFKRFRVYFNKDDCDFKLLANGQTVYQGNLRAFIKGLHEKHGTKYNLPLEAMTFSDRTSKVKIMVIFKSINGSNTGSEGFDVEFSSIRFELFVKLLNQ